MALTAKRRVFIEEYLKCWNASEAARRAEYAHPGSMGHQLLKNIEIQEIIRERITAKAMDADEVLLRLADQARADIGPYIIRNDKGDLCLAWEKLKEANQTHLVKSLTPTRYGTKIEIHDAQCALVHVGRALGLFKERVDVILDVGLTDEERVERIASIFDAARARRDRSADQA